MVKEGRIKKIRNQELKGLKSFAKDYPQADLYMLYGGSKELFVNNITILPIEKALANPAGHPHR